MGKRNGKQVRLLHRGRKSGKVFEVTVWYVELEGDVWIGSLDASRNWVRNVLAADSVDLDFGDGVASYRVERVEEQGAMERFAGAIRARFPLRSRLLALMAKGTRIVFRVRPVTALGGR